MSYMPPETPFKRAHVTATPLRTGLDDGPPLPSTAALERAYKRIEESQPRTDAERINWIEEKKYITTGIGHNGKHFAHEVRFTENGNVKRFFGRSLRSAIDAAMKGEA